MLVDLKNVYKFKNIQGSKNYGSRNIQGFENVHKLKITLFKMFLDLEKYMI
jgi:hypothetical protein